jgi:NTP pyrophosphatase (non-canonical NTP hydrolase)
MRTLTEMAQDCWQVAEDHGFHGPVPPYGKPRTFGDACALIHSEVSEAFEAWRQDGNVTWATGPDGKLEGPAAELADVVIRCFDTALSNCGLSAEAFASLIEAKIAYNRDRPYRHGKAL